MFTGHPNHNYSSPTRLPSSTVSNADNPFSSPKLIQSSPRIRSPFATDNSAAAAFASSSLQGTVNNAHSDQLLASLLLGGERDLNRLSIQSSHNPPSTTSSDLSNPFASTLSFGSSSLSSLSPSHSSSPTQDEFYYSFLKFAREGDAAALKRLVPLQGSTVRFDINHADRDGDTALHRAAAGGHTAVIQLLILQYHADIHRKNQLGETPLLVNAKSSNCSVEVLTFLIECGSDVHEANSAGLNTLQLCDAASSSTAATSNSLFPQFSHSTVLSPFGSSTLAPSSPPQSTAVGNSEVSRLLLSAHSKPQRSFVLNQQREIDALTKERDQLLAQTRGFAQMQQDYAVQQKQLQQSRQSLAYGLSQLQELDQELTRTFSVQQTQIQADQLQQQLTSGVVALPKHPTILVTEIRQALAVIRNAFSNTPNV